MRRPILQIIVNNFDTGSVWVIKQGLELLLPTLMTWVTEDGLEVVRALGGNDERPDMRLRAYE